MPRHFPVEGEITGLHTSTPSHVVENWALASTSFNNNSVAIPRTPGERTTIRNVSIHRCQLFACIAYGALFEDVTVTDIRGGGLAMSFLWGCVYSRVTLRGWISGILFRWQVDLDDARRSRAFLLENLRLYQSIDWALDISAAKFSFTLDLPGVPAHLVRRNPDTQFVLTRERAQEIQPQRKRFGMWASIANDLLETGLDGTVVAVGGRGKSLLADLEHARQLRNNGVLA